MAAATSAAPGYAGHSWAPWRVGEEVGSDCGRYEFLPIVDTNGTEVAFLQVPDFKDSAPILANARLIAAAPDVVREASRVMALLAEHGPLIVPHLLDSDDNTGQRLRTAIAAATGEAV